MAFRRREAQEAVKASKTSAQTGTFDTPPDVAALASTEAYIEEKEHEEYPVNTHASQKNQDDNGE